MSEIGSGKTGTIGSAEPLIRPGLLNLLIIAACSLLGGFTIAGTPAIFLDGDVSWHIAAGEWMIDHRSVPLFDPFSFSAYGHRWIAHEWLGELLMGIAYRIGGFPGVGLLTVGAVVATLAMCGLWMRRWAGPLELAVAMILLPLGLGTFVLARPMVLAWPMLCVWLAMLLKARDRGDAPPWWTVPLMVVWVNLHASWAIGILLAGAFGLEALIESRQRGRTFAEWLAYGAALIAATLINPNFHETLLIPLQAFASASIVVIQEFGPTDFSFTPWFEIALIAILAAGWWRGARLAPVRILIMLAMLHLALAHMRHQILFLIVGAFVLVPALTRRWIDGLPPKPPVANAMRLGGRGSVMLVTVSALVFAAICAARLLQPFSPTESKINPVHGLAAIPASLRTQPVLNQYSLGGPLVLRGIRPFVDGRGDVYGQQFIDDYVKIDSGDAAAFAAADRRWRFRWSIVSPGNTAMVAMLDRMPGWRRHYADRFTVIHVRQTEPTSAPTR